MSSSQVKSDQVRSVQCFIGYTIFFSLYCITFFSFYTCCIYFHSRFRYYFYFFSHGSPSDSLCFLQLSFLLFYFIRFPLIFFYLAFFWFLDVTEEFKPLERKKGRERGGGRQFSRSKKLMRTLNFFFYFSILIMITHTKEKVVFKEVFLRYFLFYKTIQRVCILLSVIKRQECHKYAVFLLASIF